MRASRGTSALRRHARILSGALAGSLLAATCLLGALAYSIPLPHREGRTPAPIAKSTTAYPEPAVEAVPPLSFEPLSPQQAAIINASVPFSALPSPAAKPFATGAIDPADRSSALTCLTMAIYYEAASQSDDGQGAVAQVVLNRVRNPLFPKTVCGVVFQGSALASGCQFTFTCDGSLARQPSQAGWKRAAAAAEKALDGHVESLVGEATHYHTVWVVPYWQPSLVKVVQIGAHIFYRWSGPLGAPPAFEARYAGAEPPAPQIPGFDTGFQPPVMVTKVAPAVSQAPLAVVIAPPAVMTPQVAVAQTAMLVLPKPALEVAVVTDERPKGFFGGGSERIQHLAMPGH